MNRARFIGSSLLCLATVAPVAAVATSTTTHPAGDRAVSLQPTASEAGSRFGQQVAVSGNTAVVEASQDTTAGTSFIYQRPASGWPAKATPTATLSITASSEYGSSLPPAFGLNGGVVAVGEPTWGSSAPTDRGQVLVFVRPSAGWQTTSEPSAQLEVVDGDADELGASVAVSANVIAVGAPDTQVGKNAGQGQVDVYLKPAGGWSGTIEPSATLSGSFGESGDAFGAEVAITNDGNTIAVTAPDHQDGYIPLAGMTYVFVKPTTGWSGALTETRKLQPSDYADAEYFGNAGLAIDNSEVLIGAPAQSTQTLSGAGAAYVFTQPQGGWGSGTVTLNESAQLRAPDPTLDAGFGQGDSIVGKTLDIGSLAGDGYQFEQPATGWSGTDSTATEFTPTSSAANCTQSLAANATTLLLGTPCAGNSSGTALLFTPPKPSLSAVSASAKRIKLTLNASANVKFNFGGHRQVFRSYAAGRHTYTFNGKVDGRKLRTGKHAVTITATNAAGASPAKQKTFTIN